MVARHARAAYVETWFSDEGGSLTLEGREQARLLGASLVDEDVVAVVTSDTSRAVQTGEIAAAQLARTRPDDGPGLSVTAVKALREVFLGDLIGTAFHVERIDEVTRRWHAGDLDVRFRGGESGTEVVERHRDSLDAVARQFPGGTVLVVGHQTALGVALPALALPVVAGGRRGVSAAYARDHPLGNTERAVLTGAPGHWTLTGWGPPAGPAVSAPRRP